jgi:hypothetical protein
VFSCKIFKDYFNVIRVTLHTVHETEKTHNSEMKSMSQLDTKGDIINAVDQISGPSKFRRTIRALSIRPPEIITDVADNDNESDRYRGMTANEEESVQDFRRKYTIDNNSLPFGWLDLSSFMNSKYIGNVSELWSGRNGTRKQ